MQLPSEVQTKFSKKNYHDLKERSQNLIEDLMPKMKILKILLFGGEVCNCVFALVCVCVCALVTLYA